MHHIAAQWIVGLLRARNIPFLICGGLAAKGYGSERELNDIDLFVPGKHFASVVQAGQELVSKAAAHRQEEGWDLTYVQFKYGGIKVEVVNADGLRIFDAGKETWVPLNIDFSRYTTVHLLGLELPLMLKEDLIRYKSALSRPVDIEDIHAIQGSAQRGHAETKLDPEEQQLLEAYRSGEFEPDLDSERREYLTKAAEETSTKDKRIG